MNEETPTILYFLLAGLLYAGIAFAAVKCILHMLCIEGETYKGMESGLRSN